MNARGLDLTGLAYLIAMAAAGYAVYRVAKGAPTVAQAVQRVADAAVSAVNPADPNNLANRAANRITAWLTDDPNMTPGLWLETKLGGGNREGNALLSKFSGIDAEDADLGAAMRRMQRRGDSAAWTAADQEDRDAGFAMSAEAGAAFFDNSKLRRGVFR